eukprot:8072023-Alexandrium_andersonii.AAC.1
MRGPGRNFRVLICPLRSLVGRLQPAVSHGPRRTTSARDPHRSHRRRASSARRLNRSTQPLRQ